MRESGRPVRHRDGVQAAAEEPGGQGQGEGARPCPLAQIMLRAEKDLENNETRDSGIGNPPPPSPDLSPPNRPNAGDSGGEEKMGWNADPGQRAGSCPSLLSDALSGRIRGSSGLLPLHFSKNVQSPASFPVPRECHRLMGHGRPGYGRPGPTDSSAPGPLIPLPFA